MTDGGSRGEGLLASLRGLVRTLIEVAQTRLAIVASELEEQAAYFAKISLYATLSAACLFCTLVLALVFVIIASGEYRLYTVGALVLLFFAATIWSLAAFRRHLANRPKLLAATLAELEKDKTALSGLHEVDR
jgi:uncharacterized membrane protein YqjE